MILLATLVALLGGALGQVILPETLPFTGLPLALSVPFKGNPLNRDTVATVGNVLGSPWANIIKSTIPPNMETMEKVLTMLPSPEVEVTFRTSPMFVQGRQELCAMYGIGCTWDFFKREEMKEEKKEEKKLSPEEKCLKMGMGCTKEVLEKIRLSDPTKMEWLCRTKGIACGEAWMKTQPWASSSPEWLCANMGIGCLTPTSRTLSKEELCISLTGRGCRENARQDPIVTSEELCRIAGMGCKFIRKEIPKMEEVKMIGEKISEEMMNRGMWDEKKWGDKNWNPDVMARERVWNWNWKPVCVTAEGVPC